MESPVQELRIALRSLTRRPAFAAAAVLMLALGIGTCVAVFSVVRGVLLLPLPYAEPERIVRVHHVHVEGGVDDGQLSPDDFEDLAAATSTLSRLAAYWYAPGLSNATLTGSGEATLLEVAFVSDAFFGVLGTAPALGRLPTPEEHVAGADRVVVLSDRFWRVRFGADPAVIGSTVLLMGAPYLVTGVMPPPFTYPAESVDAWQPLSLITPEMIPRARQIRYLDALGRLGPGVDPALAEAELSLAAARLAAEHPATNQGWDRIRLQPLRDEVLGDARTPLAVLSVAVGLVLLIACANLVNLLLAHGAARQGEFAVRIALGARRSRLVRQLLAENALVGLAAGALGLLAAAWTVSVMVGLGGAEVPRAAGVRVDGGVVAFALVLALLTGLLTGLVPALRASDAPAAALREGGRSGTAGPRRSRLRGGLVAAEAAMAVMLVVAAVVMLRALDGLMRVDPGFRTDDVVAITLNVPPHRAGSVEESIEYRRALMERIAAVPGVEQVAVAKRLPLEGGGEPFGFVVEGRPDATAAFRPEAGVMIVSPDWFDVLGVPLLRGSTFDRHVTPNASGLIVNESAARRYWPGEDPIGRRVLLGDFPIDVVGVVGDVRHDALHAPPVPTAYVSIDWFARLSLRIVARTTADPRAMVAPIRAAIREFEPDQPVAALTPLGDVLYRATARERFLGTLLAGFAGLAMLLAALGIYGVVAYNVAQRLQEIGIRMALGARRRDVVRMVVLNVAAWWCAGLAAGMAGAWLLTALLSGLVHEVSPRDAVAFIAAPTLLAAAALVASALPAARAARVDPAVAFRS
jgi:predicted permease